MKITRRQLIGAAPSAAIASQVSQSSTDPKERPQRVGPADAREPREIVHTADLVIVGGGLAGACAAITAAHAGLKVVLIAEFEKRELGRLCREELQCFLDRKAATGLSYSVVAHLRWDLRQILRMAVTEGNIRRNPAELLIIPPEAPRPIYSSMTFDQVRLFFSVLYPREKVIAGLAILAGMRPGEIFALTRSRVERAYANIDQRIDRGQIGTPKSPKSRRWAAMGDGLSAWIAQWLEMLPDTRPESWLFPSERIVTPLNKDNCWRRDFLPRLKPIGLEWANFQVMRRTHSSLAAELEVDPQVRADQMGHTVDVNQNTYTRASLGWRRRAVNALEKAVGIQ